MRLRQIPLAILILFFIASFTFSQTFTWDVGDTVAYANPGDYYSFHTYLINNSANPIVLQVVRLTNQIPSGWQTSICTSLGCLPPFVDSTTVSIPGSGMDSVLLDFITDANPAVGTVTMKVENLANPSEFYIHDFTLSTGPSGIRNKPGMVTGKFRLLPNYPNPFNPSTTIPFEVGGTGLQKTTLSIYNIIGQHLLTLVDGELSPGYYEAQWNGRDRFGRPVPSGIYFYELHSENITIMGKMVLMK